MVNFKNNVTVVIATLKWYRYGPRAIQISMGCYNALNESMALNGIQWFSIDYALELSSGIIKEFNFFDNGHKTPEAKNAYNSRIRKFLIYLEMKKAISMGMHLVFQG